MWGVKEGCRVVPWVAEDGGGGMLGGVDRGCVFTSAGESGIAAAFFSFLSAAVGKVGAGEKRKPVKQVEREGDQHPQPSAWSTLLPPPQQLGLGQWGTPSWTQGGGSCLCPQSQVQSQGLANCR